MNPNHNIDQNNSPNSSYEVPGLSNNESNPLYPGINNAEFVSPLHESIQSPIDTHRETLQQSPLPPVAPVSYDPSQSQIQPVQSQQDSGSIQPSLAPPIANSDGDNDQKIIAQAKRIIEHTKHDPYMQAKQISQLKADYMKQKFGRNIKVNET